MRTFFPSTRHHVVLGPCRTWSFQSSPPCTNSSYSSRRKVVGTLTGTTQTRCFRRRTLTLSGRSSRESDGQFLNHLPRHAGQIVGGLPPPFVSGPTVIPRPPPGIRE